MFCPNCGLDEKQPNQFCRACGANLSPVIDAISRPDSVTAAAISAREEIGRAMAEKIREMSSASDIKKIAEDVLPEIEKFLESPEDKRLRRMRTGTIIAFVGLGMAIALTLVGILNGGKDILFISGLGLITFFIGIAFVLNGYMLSVGKKTIEDQSSSADRQRRLDTSTPDLLMERDPEPIRPFRSVTEGTTTHLDRKDPR